MIAETTDALGVIYKEDSTELYRGEFDAPVKQSFSDNIILKIVEDRGSSKVINGYSCFKVIYQYKESKRDVDDNYLEFAGDTIFQREMWVSEKIKSLYHPIVFEKAILERYYPLNILQTQSDIKGFERAFVLETLITN